MQAPQAKLKLITLLLASWPSATGEGDGQLRAYLLAVDDYPLADVEAGVTSLVKGAAPGVNPNFLPPPAVVGAECRRQMNLRLEREARTRKPALPPPEIVHSAEERARVKAMVDDLVSRNAQAARTEDADRDRRMRGLADRTNANLGPDMSTGSMLHRLGYEVGDPDGERDVA